MTDSIHPTCSRAADVAALDGQTIQVVGTYTQKLSPAKKGGEGLFMGYIAIALEGRAEEYDPSAWSEAPAQLDLGREPRSDDEITALSGKRVTVVGTLMMDPTIHDEPSLGARTRPKPALVRIQSIQATDN